MSGASRLPEGGAIDRSRPLRFRFDGKFYQGFAGDTLASALLANGVRLIGRSFKYHRPRGVFSAGAEEPNALVTLRGGARAEPNTRATMIDLYQGLEASSQNRWPSLGFDVLAVNNLLSPLFVAGFYYKTFMWPRRFWEPVYERLIRKAAGLGAAAREPDPDRYAHRQACCDVLVIGAGPAGLGAALAAAEAGADVLLVDERSWLGGQLAYERETIDGQDVNDWLAAQQARLKQLANVRVLTRTTAFGLYDGNVVGLTERVADHLPRPQPHQPRQCFWTVRPQRIVLATGAIERPIALVNNDRPGVMLAGAVRAYANRFAVAAGREIALFTTHDDAYRTALDLTASGAKVPLLIDARPEPDAHLIDQTRERGIEVLTGQAVLAVQGGRRVRGITFAPFADGRVTGPERSQYCDVLAVSGGWTPTVHLHSHCGHKPKFDPQRGIFVPDRLPEGVHSAGACNGLLGTAACIAAGRQAGRDAAAACGFQPAGETSAVDESPQPPLILWSVPGTGKRFVDLQHDVTVADVELSHREGYRSVEHLKRYTTLGMANDQGKTSNMAGLAVMAGLEGAAIPDLGTTTFRPPYDPVSLQTLAGRRRGDLFAPVKRLALEPQHRAAGAHLRAYGGWLRPAWYGDRDAIAREVRTARERAALFDGSPLGKIEVIGPDAERFLDFIYYNTVATLKPGRARYGFMLTESGKVFDDGVLFRLAADRFVVSCSSSHVEAVATALTIWRQDQFDPSRVHIHDTTPHWTTLTVTGPASKRVLEALDLPFDLDDAALPHMAVAEAEGLRLARVSFTGDRSYELSLPARRAEAFWSRIRAAGADVGLGLLGSEALLVMRQEKGLIIVGKDTDGTTLPQDLGLTGPRARKQGDYVGKRSLFTEEATRPGRRQLVGLDCDGSAPLPVGGHIVAQAERASQGYVTSACFSPTLNRPIALGLVRDGAGRMGEMVVVYHLGARRPARIAPLCAFDPSWERLHA